MQPLSLFSVATSMILFQQDNVLLACDSVSVTIYTRIAYLQIKKRSEFKISTFRRRRLLQARLKQKLAQHCGELISHFRNFRTATSRFFFCFDLQ